MKVVAILSSTVISGAGKASYDYEPLNAAPNVIGLKHFVGHPATRFLIDQAGGMYTPGYFGSLAVGESFFVAQLKDPRKAAAFTLDNPTVGPDDLQWGVVTRTA